jgi:4-amino-4-deoxy-L-arabinose transferase-like glycosyltransferase
MISFFGVHEWSLTFISLMAGIGSLLFLYLIAKKLKIHAVAIIYLCLLFSFSELAIRYSTELKQYALDAFLILAFLFYAIDKKEEDFSFKYAIQLAIFGGLAIWASMPIIFLLAAIGLYYLTLFIRNRLIKLSHLLIIGSTWLISFAIYYFMILKTDAGSDYLQNFHQAYFFNLIPTNLDSAKQSFSLLLGLFTSLTDQTVISLIGTILIFIFGCVQIIRQKKKAGFLMLMTVFLCLLASHLGMYSLLTRLTLFMIPLLLLVFVYGFSNIWQRYNRVVKVVLFAFMVLTVVNKKGYEYFWKKMEFEDAKIAMNFLETNRLVKDPIYVYHSAIPSFVFYNNLHMNAKKFEGYYQAKWDETPGLVFLKNEKLQSGDIFWLYYTHTKPEEQLEKDFDSLIGKATRLEEHRGEQSIVIKYQYL